MNSYDDLLEAIERNQLGAKSYTFQVASGAHRKSLPLLTEAWMFNGTPWKAVPMSAKLYPDSIEIVEVSARDGLQNETTRFAMRDKLASVAGLGNWPFAPDTAGNEATEDVASMLGRAGAGIGLVLNALIETNQWLSGVMEKDSPAVGGEAGGLPKPKVSMEKELA